MSFFMNVPEYRKEAFAIRPFNQIKYKRESEELHLTNLRFRLQGGNGN